MYESNFVSCLVAAYMVCSNDTYAVVCKYQSAVCTLAYCSKVEFCTSPPPGCAILTVSDKCEVHLLLRVCVVGHHTQTS
jgi:valyl-tRNA synthetase